MHCTARHPLAARVRVLCHPVVIGQPHPRSALMRGGVAFSALLLTRGSHALCMTGPAAASAAQARASGRTLQPHCR